MNMVNADRMGITTAETSQSMCSMPGKMPWTAILADRLPPLKNIVKILLLIFLSMSAQGANLGENLLANAGFESGSASINGEIIVIPNWNGQAAIGRYAQPPTPAPFYFFPGIASPGSENRGDKYLMNTSVFNGSLRIGTGVSIYQSIDVSTLISQIPQGMAVLQFSMYSGGSVSTGVNPSSGYTTLGWRGYTAAGDFVATGSRDFTNYETISQPNKMLKRSMQLSIPALQPPIARIEAAIGMNGGRNGLQLTFADNISLAIFDSSNRPVAQDITITVSSMDAPQVATLIATDPLGLPMTFEIGTDPSQGSASIVGQGPDVTYTRSTPLSGLPDSFTYYVKNSAGKISAEATVTVMVEPDALLNSIPPDFRDPGLTTDPVRYGTGEIHLTINDLDSFGFSNWGQRRSYSNIANSRQSLVGNGWYLNDRPYVSMAANGLNVVWKGADTSFVFVPNGTGFSPLHFHLPQLTKTATDLNFADPSGNTAVFFGFDSSVPIKLRGSLKQYIDPNGGVTSTTYDANGRLQSMQRTLTPGGVTETIAYTYNASGFLSNVKRQTTTGGTTTTVRQVDYDYYTGAVGEFGEANTLKRAIFKDGAATPSEISRNYYRYYRKNESLGFTNGLKFEIGPLAYARAAKVLGKSPEAATDGELRPHAEQYFEYDANRRVVRQELHRPGIDSSGTFLYAYSTSSFSNTYNNWKTKTIETLPDGNQTIVYCNYIAQVLLKVKKEVATGKQWIDFYQYDSAGREILHATPSAMTGFDETKRDLVDLVSGNSPFIRDSDGLILRKVYYSSTTATATTTGGVAGYLQHEQTQKGELGPIQVTRTLEYFAHSN